MSNVGTDGRSPTTGLRCSSCGRCGMPQYVVGAIPNSYDIVVSGQHGANSEHVVPGRSPTTESLKIRSQEESSDGIESFELGNRKAIKSRSYSLPRLCMWTREIAEQELRPSARAQRQP
jgi:hypothetical protein